jgi:hypothetical protein
MEAIEMTMAAQSIAFATRQMFEAFKAQGFTEAQAMDLTAKWLTANTGRAGQ